MNSYAHALLASMGLCAGSIYVSPHESSCMIRPNCTQQQEKVIQSHYNKGTAKSGHKVNWPVIMQKENNLLTETTKGKLELV